MVKEIQNHPAPKLNNIDAIETERETEINKNLVDIKSIGFNRIHNNDYSSYVINNSLKGKAIKKSDLNKINSKYDKKLEELEIKKSKKDQKQLGIDKNSIEERSSELVKRGYSISGAHEIAGLEAVIETSISRLKLLEKDSTAKDKEKRLKKLKETIEKNNNALQNALNDYLIDHFEIAKRQINKSINERIDHEIEKTRNEDIEIKKEEKIEDSMPLKPQINPPYEPNETKDSEIQTQTENTPANDLKIAPKETIIEELENMPTNQPKKTLSEFIKTVPETPFEDVQNEEEKMEVEKNKIEKLSPKLSFGQLKEKIAKSEIIIDQNKFSAIKADIQESKNGKLKEERENLFKQLSEKQKYDKRELYNSPEFRKSLNLESKKDKNDLIDGKTLSEYIMQMAGREVEKEDSYPEIRERLKNIKLYTEEEIGKMSYIEYMKKHENVDIVDTDEQIKNESLTIIPQNIEPIENKTTDENLVNKKGSAQYEIKDDKLYWEGKKIDFSEKKLLEEIIENIKKEVDEKEKGKKELYKEIWKLEGIKEVDPEEKARALQVLENRKEELKKINQFFDELTYSFLKKQIADRGIFNAEKINRFFDLIKQGNLFHSAFSVIEKEIKKDSPVIRDRDKKLIEKKEKEWKNLDKTADQARDFLIELLKRKSEYEQSEKPNDQVDTVISETIQPTVATEEKNKENSDYEKQRAEIEKSRKEELKSKDLDHFFVGDQNQWGVDARIDNEKNNIEIATQRNETARKELAEGLLQRFLGDKKNINEIKDKYDAKLAELDKKFGKESQFKENSAVESVEEKIEESESVEKSVDEEKQEKINTIIDAFLDSILETKKLEEKYAQLIEARKKMDEEEQKTISENSTEKEEVVETPKEESNSPDKENSPTKENSETKINKNEGGRSLGEKFENITIEDLRWSFPKNYIDRLGTFYVDENFNITIEEVSMTEKERSQFGKRIHSSPYKTLKLKKPYCELKINKPGVDPEIKTLDTMEDALAEVNKIIKDYSKKVANDLGEVRYIPYDYFNGVEKIENNIKYFIKENILSALKKDSEEKKFLYFAAEKFKNQLLLKTTMINTITKTLDLRHMGKDWFGIISKHLNDTAENEGFFEFNILGFVKIIKNVKEIESENGIASRSYEAIYKIVGPNGEIIADNIQGYDEADNIYWGKTNEYRKVVEEEFNKINAQK